MYLYTTFFSQHLMHGSKVLQNVMIDVNLIQGVAGRPRLTVRPVSFQISWEGLELLWFMFFLIATLWLHRLHWSLHFYLHNDFPLQVVGLISLETGNPLVAGQSWKHMWALMCSPSGESSCFWLKIFWPQIQSGLNMLAKGFNINSESQVYSVYGM